MNTRALHHRNLMRESKSDSVEATNLTLLPTHCIGLHLVRINLLVSMSHYMSTVAQASMPAPTHALHMLDNIMHTVTIVPANLRTDYSPCMLMACDCGSSQPGIKCWGQCRLCNAYTSRGKLLNCHIVKHLMPQDYLFRTNCLHALTVSLL